MTVGKRLLQRERERSANEINRAVRERITLIGEEQCKLMGRYWELEQQRRKLQAELDTRMDGQP